MKKDRRNKTLHPIGEMPDENENDQTVRIQSPQRQKAQVDDNSGAMTIRVVAGRDMLSFVILEPGTQTLIGRDESAELRLHDRAVSSRHAVISYSNQGMITLIDIGSTNGTYVNGKKIQSCPLQDGDYVEIGDAALRVSWLSMAEILHLQRVLNRLNAANTDPLTGLLTRTYLQEDAHKLVQRCEERKLPLSVSFIDLDKFKYINDTYGHQVGDEVLKNISRLIMMRVRGGDHCVRYGGDELLIFFPGIGEGSAYNVVNRIRTSILKHDWSRIAQGLTISGSFGVADFVKGDDLKSLLNKADQAVYAAKKAGRNTVIAYSKIPKT